VRKIGQSETGESNFEYFFRLFNLKVAPDTDFREFFMRLGILNRKFFVVACIAGLSVVFVACKKDSGGSSSSNDSNNSGGSVSDPEGTVMVSMRNSNNGDTRVYPFGYGCDCFFRIDIDNIEGRGANWTFVSMGSISGLGAITQIPTSGWAFMVSVKEKYGYVGKSVWYPYSGGKDSAYVRIYVDSYMTGTNGGIIGAEVKYQSPFVP